MPNIQYSDSDSDTDYTDDDLFISITYEPEEISKTKFSIVLCYLDFPNYIVEQRFKIMPFGDSFLTISLFGFYDTLDLAECIYLNTGECVAIKKTLWIKLIQRTWKKVVKERKDIFKKRCLLSSLKYREIYGKWPNTCNYLPTLKGMLNRYR